MLVYHNIDGVEYNEIKSFRFWNYAGEPTVSDASNKKGLFVFDTVAGKPKYHDGTSWRSFLYGIAAGDIPLSENYVLTGNSSNVATGVLRSAIPISAWGSATANVNMGTSYKITNLLDPTSNQDAATKYYVDSVAQGMGPKEACVLATDAALPRSPTYNTGTLRLTAGSNGALTATEVDSGSSYTLLANDRVLVKNQATSSHNGIYYVYQIGSAGTPYILERTTDTNTNAELLSATTFIEEGTYEGDTWLQNSTTFDITVPSGDITWVKYSEAGVYSEGNGIDISAGVISLFVASATTWTQGCLFYGSSTTAVGKLDAGSSAGLFLYNAGASTAPAWSVYTLPSPGSNLTANSVWYSSSTTAVSQLSPTNKGVLRLGATGTPGYTSVSTQYYFLQMGASNAEFVDLFGAANTWTGAQTLNPGTSPTDSLVVTTNALTGTGTRSSSYLRFTSHGYDTSNHTGNWRVYSFASTNAGASTLLIDHQLDSGGYTTKLSLTDGYILNLLNGGEFRIYDSDGSNYVGLKSPSTVSSDKTWYLPTGTDTANYYLSTNGSGQWAFQQITAAHIGSGQTLSRTNDTNVTLTLGGTPGSCLLTAASITVGWSGSLAVSRGGTGQSSSLTQYGIIYANATTTMASTAAPGATGTLLRGNTGGAPSWTGYSIPASLSGANSLLVSSSSSVLAELTPTASRVLVTNGSSVISWGGILNVSRATSGGIARKHCAQIQGTGAATSFDVTHNFSSRDVVLSIRLSAVSESGAYEAILTKWEVKDENTVTVYFLTAPTSSDYYVVTVVG